MHDSLVNTSVQDGMAGLTCSDEGLRKAPRILQPYTGAVLFGTGLPSWSNDPAIPKYRWRMQRAKEFRLVCTEIPGRLVRPHEQPQALDMAGSSPTVRCIIRPRNVILENSPRGLIRK